MHVDAREKTVGGKLRSRTADRNQFRTYELLDAGILRSFGLERRAASNSDHATGTKMGARPVDGQHKRPR